MLHCLIDRKPRIGRTLRDMMKSTHAPVAVSSRYAVLMAPETQPWEADSLVAWPPQEFAVADSAWSRTERMGLAPQTDDVPAPAAETIRGLHVREIEGDTVFHQYFSN
jgi:hypothetical protein